MVRGFCRVFGNSTNKAIIRILRWATRKGEFAFNIHGGAARAG